jgi:alkylation response protein AidB-like acyl-CoA dehydrogenase
VIRWKIAEMARQVESTHAMLETLTYQLATMTTAQANALGGDTALIKVQATKVRPASHTAKGRTQGYVDVGNDEWMCLRLWQVFEYCAREAAQIFGGASYVRGGQGEKVERLYREVRAYAIPGT